MNGLGFDHINNDPPQEYFCYDGEEREYTRYDLACLSLELLAKIEGLVSRTVGSESLKSEDQEACKVTEKLCHLYIGAWPKTAYDNVFLGCTVLFSPRIGVDISHFEPLLSEDPTTPSMMIGLKYSVPTPVTAPPFGVVCKAEAVVKILLDAAAMESLLHLRLSSIAPETTNYKVLVNTTSCAGEKPTRVHRFKASVAFWGNDFSMKKIHVCLHNNRIYLEIPLFFKIQGAINADGQAYLETGQVNWEELCFQETDRICINSHFRHKPTTFL